MDVVVFTQAKDSNVPDANEDRIVIVDGRAYGVIDGVTDKTGKRFDGLTGGQIAARLVEATVRRAVLESPAEAIDAHALIGRINDAFRAEFERMGIDPPAGAPTNAPLAAQLVLALVMETKVRFILIGDAGLRINGDEVFRQSFPLDRIGAAIRKLVWRHMMNATQNLETSDRIARAYTVAGLGEVLPEATRWIDAATLATLRRMALQTGGTILPDAPDAAVEAAVLTGMREQYRYANRVHPLGFATLNGSPVPAPMIVEFERDLSELRTIELFSDGYFGCPDGTGLDDWEDWFARVEAEDPAKVGRHESTKGSVAGRFADDRTIVIVRNVGTHAARRRNEEEETFRPDLFRS